MLALPMITAANLSSNYNIALEENGNAMVVLIIRGIGTINVPLPLDVKSPAVRGALYVQSSNGVDVSIDADGTSTIVYKTAMLTNRQGNQWEFMMDLPEFHTASIILTIPENTRITNTTPNAAITQVGGEKNIIWNINPQNQARVSAHFTYTASEPDVTSLQGNPRETALKAVILAAVIFTGFLAAIILIKSRRSLVYSRGKQNVLKTLSGNETKIVNMLLQNPDGIQRNKLERESGMPKSSLAAAIQNLEKKNVVTVDRSYSTHYVELTEWFKSL